MVQVLQDVPDAVGSVAVETPHSASRAVAARAATARVGGRGAVAQILPERGARDHALDGRRLELDAVTHAAGGYSREGTCTLAVESFDRP